MKVENKPRISERALKVVSALLADSYLLLLKTQNFHWNVEGPHFAQLHSLFESQYQELFAAVDAIAERLRAVGVCAPGSWAQFAQMASLAESVDSLHDADTMLHKLSEDHETLVDHLRKVMASAPEVFDPVTMDLLTQRLSWHEKTLWIINSHIGREK